MSSPEDTTGKLPTNWKTHFDTDHHDGASPTERYYDIGWHNSPERTTALAAYNNVDYLRPMPFVESSYFRDARYAYRKRVNRSWGKEST